MYVAFKHSYIRIETGRCHVLKNERTCKTCCDEEVEKMSGNLANALCLHGDGEQKWGSW